MKNDMKNPWQEIAPPTKDIAARRIDHTHPLDLFWARDQTGRYVFVYQFQEKDAAPNIDLPELVGISADYIPAQAGDLNNLLVLFLNEQSNWEIFYSLCIDLVEATRSVNNSSDAIRGIVMRLNRWQDFLKKKRTSLLSEDEIKGLIGELLFIKNYLIPAFGAGTAIRFWQGPEGLPQDFNVNNSAVEVKCQAGSTAPYVKITSSDQLCPQLPEMYLFVVTLGKTSPETENAINLPILVKDIRDILQIEDLDELERFNDLLYMLGYFHSDRYIEYSYLLVGDKTFHVVDGFPRICTNDVHPGIVKLSYSISLTKCIPFEGHPDWMEYPA